MEVSCPVSAERINENVVRMIVFMVAIIAIYCLLFANYWAILFLIFDFATRVFSPGNFSLLKQIALWISRTLNLKPQLKDLAPKKFAATLGFVFCLLIAAMFFLKLPIWAFAFTAVMTVFALLESLFAVCVGCYVYSFINLVRKNN